APRHSQILQARYRPHRAAVRIKAYMHRVPLLVCGNRQRAQIADKIVSWISPVQQVEELRERLDNHSLPDSKIPAYSHIDLLKRRAAELIQLCLHSIDDGSIVGHSIAVYVERSRYCEGPRALELSQRRDFYLMGQCNPACYHEPMSHILA